LYTHTIATKNLTKFLHALNRESIIIIYNFICSEKGDHKLPKGVDKDGKD